MIISKAVDFKSNDSHSHKYSQKFSEIWYYFPPSTLLKSRSQSEYWKHSFGSNNTSYFELKVGKQIFRKADAVVIMKSFSH